MNCSIQVDHPIAFEVGSLYERMARLTDQRKARGKRYELALILTLSLLAKLAGQDTVVGIADWVKWRGRSIA